MCHSVCVMMLISQDLLAAPYVMALAFSQHGANYVEAVCASSEFLVQLFQELFCNLELKY